MQQIVINVKTADKLLDKEICSVCKTSPLFEVIAETPAMYAAPAKPEDVKEGFNRVEYDKIKKGEILYCPTCGRIVWSIVQ